MADLLGTATKILVPVILDRLLKQDVPVHHNNAQTIAIAAAEAAAPVLVNKANAEPWYQSRVTWGAIVSIITGFATLVGVQIAPEDAGALVAIGTASGTVIGGVITIWGRWGAKKPIGQ